VVGVVFRHVAVRRLLFTQQPASLLAAGWCGVGCWRRPRRCLSFCTRLTRWNAQRTLLAAFCFRTCVSKLHVLGRFRYPHLRKVPT
jgi:hypothetical protein